MTNGLCFILSVVLLASLFSRGNQELFGQIPEGSGSPAFVLLLERIHPAYVLITSFLLVSSPQTVGLVLLWLLILFGYITRRLVGAKSCNCFGGLAPAGTLKYKILHLILVATASAATVLVAFGSGAYDGSTTSLPGYAFIASAALALAVFLLDSHLNKMRSSRLASMPSDVDRGFSRDTKVGELSSGEIVTLGQIADTCPMILFIGVSNTCAACVTLKPALIRIVELFGRELRTVVIVDGAVSHDLELEHTLVLNGEAEFLVKLSDDQYPFGVAINSSSLRPIGSTEFGENIGALVLRVLSVALRPALA